MDNIFSGHRGDLFGDCVGTLSNELGLLWDTNLTILIDMT